MVLTLRRLSRPVSICVAVVICLLVLVLSRCRDRLGNVRSSVQADQLKAVIRLSDRLDGDKVVIFEQAIHDEVVGALAYTLREGGLDPVVIASFRFGFSQVLQAMHTDLPDVGPYRWESPYGSNATIMKRLEEDSIDYLVLTTCSSSLAHLREAIKTSSVHVVCVVHHSGAELYHKHRKDWQPLAEQGRITLVTLGHHVADQVRQDIELWAEKEESTVWENLPIEVLLPIFNYTPVTQRDPPVIFPSAAVVQGNIESGRRNYKKLFEGLEECLIRDASIWGYHPLVSGKPVEPLQNPGASPFVLHLLGQLPKGSDLKIPVELENVIKIHPGLEYPDFYKAIAESDVVLPAFAQNGPYFETTSSSIAASVIARVPLIGTKKLARSYSYLDETAILPRSLSETEIMAIERMRRASARGELDARSSRGSPAQWDRLHESILSANLEMWQRVLR